MQYFFDSWFNTIHQLQPGAVIFSNGGPDTRWIGDEAGVAGSTCWSLSNRSDAKIGGIDPAYSRGRNLVRHDWVPAECDVSIRSGWFWHPSQAPKPARTLLDIYYKSIGTTVGYHRLLQYPTVKSQSLRFVVDKSRTNPLISYLGIHMDPFSTLRKNASDMYRGKHFNISQIIYHVGFNHSHIASM